MPRELLVDLLRSELARKQARNSAYSLRSFARDLEMDASNLQKILSDQKAPGPRLKARLARKLGFTEPEVQSAALAGYGPTIGDASYREHALGAFQIVADWKHYAILELFKLKGIEKSAAEFARRLGGNEVEILECLHRLRNAGLLNEDESGALYPAEESSSSTLSVATSKAHRDQQRQILEGAIDAIAEIPVEARSQSSMTLAIDSRRLPEARALIKEFRRGLGRLLSDSPDLDHVYQLSISLYPVTQEKI